MLIYPYGLHDFVLAGDAMRPEQSLVGERQSIIRRRITIGYAAVNGCTCTTYPDCHRSDSVHTGFAREARWGAHVVTGGDAARVGLGLNGAEPDHHSRLASVLPLGPAFSQDPNRVWRRRCRTPHAREATTGKSILKFLPPEICDIVPRPYGRFPIVSS